MQELKIFHEKISNSIAELDRELVRSSNFENVQCQPTSIPTPESKRINDMLQICSAEFSRYWIHTKNKLITIAPNATHFNCEKLQVLLKVDSSLNTRSLCSNWVLLNDIEADQEVIMLPGKKNTLEGLGDDQYEIVCNNSDQWCLLHEMKNSK